MRKHILLQLISVLCIGCTAADPSEKTSNRAPAEVTTAISIEEIPIVVDPNQTNEEAAYFSFTEEQKAKIRTMIESSHAYDEYTPGDDSFVLDFYRNTIGITAQGKDVPTMWLIRFEDVRFDGKEMVYFMQRFYRESVKFNYVKNNVTKIADLEVSYHINQDNHTRANWLDRVVDCSVYVPGASGQTNYPFYYDVLENSIFVIKSDGSREPITFTEDLHNQILEHVSAKIKKFNKIDEAAQRLAQDIVAYIETLE